MPQFVKNSIVRKRKLVPLQPNSPVPFVFIIGQVKHIEIIGWMSGRTYPTLAKQNQLNRYVKSKHLIKKKKNSKAKQVIRNLNKMHPTIITWKTTMVPTVAAAWAARGEGGSPAGLILNIITTKNSYLSSNSIQFNQSSFHKKQWSIYELNLKD